VRALLEGAKKVVVVKEAKGDKAMNGTRAMYTNGTTAAKPKAARPSIEEVIQALDVLRRAGGFLEESTMFMKLGEYARG
jgi:hypothetical protein